MKWRELGDTSCSVARSLAVMGDRWTILIMRNAFLRIRRFEEFQTQMGITRHVLTDRLNKLVDFGVMKKVPYQDKPPRYEYRLTDMGRDWYSVQAAMVAWGDKWLAGKAGPPLILHHTKCGKPTTPQVTCSECGDPLDVREVFAQTGPGWVSPKVEQKA